ncbi:hypothetical protein I7I53_08183 [Histoplasma capsulatum var. duboisii H88]|uniref:Uncharacterized protein n=1 Tax=Ajellomyces capsulatus (strain H88) TaxID=544711 RepID=A0A8A1LDP1_AJEC8|nr:hypothetical protein I7I53_08183 [Histoplasma capsulatum var. duboisii H88]
MHPTFPPLPVFPHQDRSCAAWLPFSLPWHISTTEAFPSPAFQALFRAKRGLLLKAVLDTLQFFMIQDLLR